ncbi:putative ribosome biogenesis RLP24 [Brachionus plicatilis]|uniref:Probable ribosome biogenesis protein RLP24 n=1 Tax=Brachionus plicatilis TaxID=10195 RepID=A0A3M7P9C7_BRAPC|nr:putative ribosome biogenesis RLP24 [Brachionus plicatilis]
MILNMSDKNDKTLSETLFAFNNRIVASKDIIKKAKIFQTTKIVRQIKLLAKKKGNEAQLEKNKRKCEHLKEEINFIKKQKFNEIAIFAFDNDETTFDQFIKANSKNLTMETIALARVAFSKPIQKAIEDIKNDPKIPNWKQVFIKYKARCEKRKNWKEKNRLLKEIETKLKPENENSDEEVPVQEDISENLIDEPLGKNITLENKAKVEKITLDKKEIKEENCDDDLSEGYDSHDDDNWNEEEGENEEEEEIEEEVEEENFQSQEEESVDLSEKFVFSESNLEIKNENKEKNLKPLVIGEKPAHMVIKQINLDEVKDCEELMLEDKSKKVENSSQETIKVIQDPFFLDQNGNEIQGNDNLRPFKRSYNFDHEPTSYSSYDKYRNKSDGFRDRRREMGRNSFKNSLSNDSRPYRSDNYFDRSKTDFKNRDKPPANRRQFEFSKNFDTKPKEDITKLHPSWQAKKLAEEKVKSMNLNIVSKMRLEPCFFCSSKIYPGHGVTFVRNDCKVFKFCRSKCHRAFKKKRNPRKCRWTKAYRKSAGKELAVDKVFEFEQRRNEPVKYSRELWQNTIRAMERIEEIKLRRQRQFIMNRLQVGTDNRNEDDLKEITKFMHLIKAPHAVNPDLDEIHELAKQRLEDLKVGKEKLVALRKSKKIGKKREKVEVVMEETSEQNTAELEEN